MENNQNQTKFHNYTKRNNERSKDNVLYIRYLNIQGLTIQKMVELNQFIKRKNELLILTETHMNYNKIKVDKTIKTWHRMRESNDKKGGGLCIISNAEANFNITQKETKHPDLMNVTVESENLCISILVVYMSVLNKPEDNIRNNNIKKLLEQAIEDCDEATLVIGDFNGHIEEIGYQKENKNGKLMKSIIERNNLYLLNLNVVVI